MRNPTARRSVAAGAAMLLLLVACGNGDTTDGNGPPDTPTPTNGADALPDACDETQGVTDDTIRIGVFGDLSGPLADIGAAAMLPTFNAYFDRVNDAGGIGGRNVEVDFRDMRFNPVEAATQYEVIREDVAMIPFMLMPDAIAALADDMYEDCLLTFVGPQNGTLPLLHDMVFGPSTAPGHEMINGISWIIENEEGAADATWALAHGTDGSGLELAHAARYAADWYGFEFAETVTFAVTDDDMTAQAQALIGADADYVVFGGIAPQLGPTVATVVAAGGDMTFLAYTSGSPQLFVGTPAGPMIEQHTLMVSAYNPWLEAAPGLDDLAEVMATSDVPEPFHNSLQILTVWYVSMLAHQTLELADQMGDLSLGGIYRAAQSLEIDPGGMAPPIRYGQFDDAPRLPTKEARMMRVNPEMPGNLEGLSDWFVSDAADAYTPSAS